MEVSQQHVPPLEHPDHNLGDEPRSVILSGGRPLLLQMGIETETFGN